MKITPNTQLRELLKDPNIGPGLSFFIYPAVKEVLSDGDLTLAEAYRKVQPTMNIDDVVKALAFTYEQGQHQQLIYRYDEKREGSFLFYFRVPNPKGLVFLIPGGAYLCICGIYEGMEMAKAIQQRDYEVIVINYGVGKQAYYPQAVDDLAKAISYSYAHFPIPKEYLLYGFSAGGHLAGFFAGEKYGYAHYGLNKPFGVALGYPVISLLAPTEGNTRDAFLGDEHKDDPKLQKEYSIQNLVGPAYPPTFLWRSSDDPTVPFGNSEKMDEALSKFRIPHEYHIYPGYGHGWSLGVGTSAEGWLDASLDFFGKQKLQ